MYKSGTYFVLAIIAAAVLLAAVFDSESLSAKAAAPAGVEPPRDGAEQLILTLEHPDEPGVLIIQHHKGTINITGYKGAFVVVNASLRYPDSTGAKGVRPVAGSGLKFSALEKNNVVTVNTNSHERTIDLDIQVPESFSLHIEKFDSGAITAYHLSGEMDVTSSSGSVQLGDISGSAVISTVDGSIHVRFTGVTGNAPMAFTSVGGDINVFFPDNIDASVKMRTDHGEILSDFDMNVAPRKSGSGTSGETGIQRAFLEEWTCGTLGRGGAEILFRSYYGKITIRKSGNQSR
jgi:hypothetical protein